MEEKKGFFSRLVEGLTKTRNNGRALCLSTDGFTLNGISGIDRYNVFSVFKQLCTVGRKGRVAADFAVNIIGIKNINAFF